jgi:polysaccharide export outer membrane protein
MIDLGKYGRLQVVGLTVDEIQAKIKQRIEEREQRGIGQTDPSEDDGSTGVFVRLVEPQSKVYYVIGEVNSPGAYPLIGRESVLDAIFAAGGLTDRADRQRIILSRPTSPGSCRNVLPVCYRHIVQLGDTFTNYQIQPGDRIYVASLTFWREVGQALFPCQGEKCPKSACYQVSCEEETLDMELINTVTDAEQPPTGTRIR